MVLCISSWLWYHYCISKLHLYLPCTSFHIFLLCPLAPTCFLSTHHTVASFLFSLFPLSQIPFPTFFPGYYLPFLYDSRRTSLSLQIEVCTTSLLTPPQCLRYYHRNFLFRDQCPQWDSDFLPFSPPQHHVACGIIVPQPGIEHRPLGSEGTCDIVCAQWVFALKQSAVPVPSCTRTGFRWLFKCQQVAKSKLPFQKLQDGKYVGILLVTEKMVHLTYDSWKTGIKQSWPFLSFKAWRTLPSSGELQSCWNMNFVVLNGGAQSTTFLWIRQICDLHFHLI